MIAALLVAPGTVLGLAIDSAGDAYEGRITSAGAILLRATNAGDDTELAVVIDTDCGPYDPTTTPDLVASRWEDRWQTVDAFEVTGVRTLDVIAEDDGGQWRRNCAVRRVVSCYLTHGDDWLAAEIKVGGLDTQSAGFEEMLASLVAWDGAEVYPCTEARITKGIIETR